MAYQHPTLFKQVGPRIVDREYISYFKAGGVPVKVKEPKIHLHFSFSRSLKNAFLNLLGSKYKRNWIISQKELFFCIKVGENGMTWAWKIILKLSQQLFFIRSLVVLTAFKTENEAWNLQIYLFSSISLAKIEAYRFSFTWITK